MANKEKTIWCKYLVYATDEPDKIIKAIESWRDFTLYFGENDYAMIPTEQDYYKYYSIKEIIWHPVMLWDALNWLDKKMDKISKEVMRADVFYQNVYLNTSNLLNGWKKKSKPIEDQSDDCIYFIYSLIKKYERTIKLT